VPEFKAEKFLISYLDYFSTLVDAVNTIDAKHVNLHLLYEVVLSWRWLDSLGEKLPVELEVTKDVLDTLIQKLALGKAWVDDDSQPTATVRSLWKLRNADIRDKTESKRLEELHRGYKSFSIGIMSFSLAIFFVLLGLKQGLVHVIAASSFVLSFFLGSYFFEDILKRKVAMETQFCRLELNRQFLWAMGDTSTTCVDELQVTIPNWLPLDLFIKLTEVELRYMRSKQGIYVGKTV